MNIEQLRDYCLSLKGVEESFPFDETTLVFKVGGKMFCLTDLDGEFSLNLKNHPAKNIELREMYPSVSPGYHMNKQHWNTIKVDVTIPDALLYNLISESYSIVFQSLPKTIQKEF